MSTTTTTMHLLDLPPELVIGILCHLPLSALAACKCAHPALRDLIHTSLPLQYHTAAQLTDVKYNPNSDLSIHERLYRLNTLEARWARLDFDFKRQVHVAHQPSRIYNFTDGVYLISDHLRRGLDYCVLPRRPGEKMEWKRVEVEKKITKVGLNVYEHDLVAVVTTTPQDTTPPCKHTIEIVLLQLSTGLPHPQARDPRILVAASCLEHPMINIEIVGNTLVLVMTHFEKPRDDFYVFDWKSGVVRMHVKARNGTYWGVMFLTPTLLLLPNSATFTLEYWEAFPGPGTPRPLGALALPPLSSGYITSGISCRCSPNPHAGGMPHAPPHLGFLACAEEAVANFTVYFHCTRVGEQDNTDPRLLMFVRRDALVRLCRWTREEEGGEGVEREGGEGSAAQLFEVIPWDEWGPDATRWVTASARAAWWTLNAAGARVVIPADLMGTALIMDFHPARLRLGTHASSASDLAQDRDPAHEQGQTPVQNTAQILSPQNEFHKWVEHGELALEHRTFAEPVVSRLPYAGRLLAQPRKYAWMLMDEERLIGLVAGRSGLRVKEMAIHYLGSGDDDDGDDDGCVADMAEVGAEVGEDTEVGGDLQATDMF